MNKLYFCHTEVISNAIFLSFARRLCKKSARVSHEIAQFLLKITHLAISMEPTPLPERISSYDLLPRLWLLVIYLRRLLPYLEDKVNSSGI